MLLDIIKSMKSTKKYLDKPILDKDMEYIICAGKYTEYTGEDQPCLMGVVDDKNLIGELVKCCGNQRWVSKAPVIIALCTRRMSDEDIEAEKFRLGKLKDEIYNVDTNVLDIICANGHQGLMAAENIILAAGEKCISSCLIYNFDVYKASKVLKVPNSHLVTYLITLGYEESSPGSVDERPAEDTVFYNIYDK